MQVIRVTTDNAASMKAFSTCLPSWEIVEENDLDEAENEDESQMDNFLELDLHFSEFSENDECYKVIELDLQEQFGFHPTSHRTSGLRLDAKLRGACLAHTTQLVVKDALAASELLHGFLF